MNFGEKVKSARLKLFLTQEAFAKELEVSFATVNRWETGHNAPSLSAQKKFHDFCLANKIDFEEGQK